MLGFISNTASTNNVDFIFLSETISQVSLLEPVFSRFGCQGCTGINSEDNSRGLFLCWIRRVVVFIFLTSKHFICCKTSDMTANNDYNIAFVYGSPSNSESNCLE